MPARAGLAVGPSADYVYHDVELVVARGDDEGLADGAGDFGYREVLVELEVVDGNLTASFTQIDARDRGLAPSGSNSEIPYHRLLLLDFDSDGRLRRVRVVRAGIHLDVQRQLAAERTLGEHTADGNLERIGRVALDQRRERVLLEAAGKTGVPVIQLVVELVAGDLDLVGVDDHDIVTDFLMRRVAGLVLATNEAGCLGGDAAEAFALGVYDEP